MEAETAFGIMEVARHTPEPTLAEARPQQSAHRRQQQTGHHQKFAQLVHVFKMARAAREGNEGFLTQISRIDTNGSAKRLGVRRRVAVPHCGTRTCPRRIKVHLPGTPAAQPDRSVDKGFSGAGNLWAQRSSDWTFESVINPQKWFLPGSSQHRLTSANLLDKLGKSNLCYLSRCK